MFKKQPQHTEVKFLFLLTKSKFFPALDLGHFFLVILRDK